MKPPFIFNACILVICLIVNSVAFTGLRAQPVDTDQAKFVAERFFADRLSRSRLTQLKSVQTQDLEFSLVFEEIETLNIPGPLKKSDQAVPLYYIFNVKDNTNPNLNSGFIIVSADQRIPVVLGYSFSGEIAEYDRPSAFKDWMDHYKEQIISVLQNNLEPDPEISDEWKKYSSASQLKSTEQLSEVEPLLTTKWSQYGFYNNLCPEDERCGTVALNGHVPAGCVAVAMAQIMKYWNYPAKNNSIPGYTSTNYGWQPDIGETTYDWASMPEIVDAPMDPSPSDEEIEAVSTIIYHCGVAVEMDYGYQSSGAGQPLVAFKEYFKYSPDIQDVVRSGYTDEEWGNELREELDNGRPVYYAGYENDSEQGGHAFVCDGYQDGDYFHFNWGLNLRGIGNGFFHINDLTPGGSNFNFKQWAHIGISPASSLVDADGNYYDIVEIGSQVWMAENLKTTTLNDGTAIAYPGTDNSAWESNVSGAYAWYDNDDANKSTYGAMYNQYAVNSDNLCPADWHVPSLNEWLTLMTFLGDGSEFDGRLVGGGLLKEEGNAHWTPDNTGATDAFGFTALPGGIRNVAGSYLQLGSFGHWWASGTWWQDAAMGGTGFMFVGSSEGVWYGAVDKNAGICVRCVRDAAAGSLPVDTEAFIYGYTGYEEPGEEMWYKFLTGAAGSYAIQTYGSTDTYMYLYDNDRTALMAQDNNDGSGNNAKIAESLQANTWYYIKITGYGGSTGGYSIGVITLPDAPEANDVTIAYDGLQHAADASVPSGVSIVWYDAASGGNEAAQPTGINCGTYTAYAEAVNDVTGGTSLNRTPITLTINPVVLSVTADNQLSQYSDPLKDLTYEIAGFVNGENISVIGGAPDISTSAAQFSAPGEYDIIVGTGTLSAENYFFNLVNETYTISKEDARADYTGSSLAATAGNNSGHATITLRATVRDISATVDAAGDIYPGDIRNARVRFLNDGTAITGTGTDMDGWMTPDLVNPLDLKTGVVVLNWPVDIGDKTDVIYTIGIEVNNYYVRNNLIDNTLVTIYKPSGEFITGGGFIINPENTEGTFAADPGLKTNFGFNVKFNKKSKNLKGNMNIILRRTVDGIVHNFQIKSNSMTSLGVNTEDAAAQKAVFVSKATMRDLTDPLYGYSKGGLILQVNMTDRGKPGSSDAIAISVYDRSMLLFSSNWTGISTAETVLAGGNLVVHSGFSMNNGRTKSLTIMPGPTRISQAEFEMIAYPNPFEDRIYFDLQLMNDSEIQLEIFDITGSKIASVYNGNVVANVSYRLEYVLEKSYSGTCIYRLTVNGRQLYTGKLIHK